MNHIAIDLGGRKSQVCVRDAVGKIIKEQSCETTRIIEHLPREPRGRVVLETCAEAFTIARQIRCVGLEPVVVPSLLAKQLGVGQRGLKTDIRDARALSEMSCRMEHLPTVHIPSEVSRDHRSMITARDSLVSSRTALINSVRGWMRTMLLKAGTGAPETFPKRVRAVCEGSPSGLPSYIDSQLIVIESINAELAKNAAEIKQIADTHPITQRLQSIPGVGPITSLSFMSTVDDVTRFSSPGTLSSYLGLTPAEQSSGGRINRLGITKAGCARTRTALIQASWVLWRVRPHDPNVVWAKKIAERRGKQKAIVALARKLARIMFAMWRDEKNYIHKKLDDHDKEPAQGNGTQGSDEVPLRASQNLHEGSLDL